MVLYTIISLLLEVGILYYVAQEYYESKELNNKLNKVYRSKKKKINADKLVKEVLKQEVQ